MNLPSVETGDKTQSPGTAASPVLENTCVVIHLRYDGIRVLVSDSSKKQILELFSTDWLASKDPGYLIDECEKFFRESGIKLQQATEVQWLFSFSKFCLVPDILYQQGSGETLLKQTSRIGQNEQVFSDFWTRRDIVGMYAVDGNLVEYIRQQNPNTNMAHNGYALNALYNRLNAEKDFYCLQVSPSFAELFIVQQSKVVFYNQFPHDVDEDLLYYILFALEQNRLLAPEVTLYISGDIQKGNGLYSLLSKYIGKVEDVKLPARQEAARQLTTNRLRQSVNLISML